MIHHIAHERVLASALALEVPVVRHSAVYFLLHKGKVVYVGQTTSVHGTIDRHLKERRALPSTWGSQYKYRRRSHTSKTFDRIVFFKVPARRLDTVERACITYFDPKYNTARFHRKVPMPVAEKTVSRLLRDQA